MLEITERIKEERIKTHFKTNEDNRKLIHIFDIDGTILENIFVPLKRRKAKDDQTTILELREKLKALKLYPEFIEYYKLTKNRTLHNFFITGRKASHFSDITLKQLKPLEYIKNFILYHYPESNKHNLNNYYKFKNATIITTILEALKNYKNFEIRLFDDDFGYFNLISKQVIEDIKEKIFFLAHEIHSNEDWKFFKNLEVLQC